MSAAKRSPFNATSSEKLSVVDQFGEAFLAILRNKNFKFAAKAAKDFVQRHTGATSTMRLYHGTPKDISTTFDPNLNTYFGSFPDEVFGEDGLAIEDIRACCEVLRWLPLFALRRGRLESEHMEEMTKLIERYLRLRGRLPDRRPARNGANDVPPRRGPRVSITKHDRNKIIREHWQKMRRAHTWARLAQIVNADSRFAKLGLPTITRGIARDTCISPKQRRPARRKRN